MVSLLGISIEYLRDDSVSRFDRCSCDHDIGTRVVVSQFEGCLERHQDAMLDSTGQDFLDRLLLSSNDICHVDWGFGRPHRDRSDGGGKRDYSAA